MDPVSALGVAAAACQLAEQVLMISDGLYQYFKEVKQSPKLSRELRQEVLLLSDVLENLRSAFPAEMYVKSLSGPRNTSMNDLIEEFEAVVKKMADRMKIEESGISWKRLRWPFDQKENEKYLEKFERFKSIFQLALQTIQK
jgi:hypothetical protein